MNNTNFEAVARTAKHLAQWLLMISLGLIVLAVGMLLVWCVDPTLALGATYFGRTDGINTIQSFGIVAAVATQIGLLGIAAVALRRLFLCFRVRDFADVVGPAAERVRFWTITAFGWSVIAPTAQSVLASPGLWQGEIQISFGVTVVHLTGLLMALLTTLMARMVCLLASLWQDFEATV